MCVMTIIFQQCFVCIQYSKTGTYSQFFPNFIQFILMDILVDHIYSSDGGFTVHVDKYSTSTRVAVILHQYMGNADTSGYVSNQPIHSNQTK